MIGDLRRALEEREKLNGCIAQLNSLGPGEADAEQRALLSAKYAGELRAVQERIDSVRMSLQNQLVTLKTMLEAYNARQERLKADVSSGALPLEQYQPESCKLLKVYEEAAGKFRQLKRIYQAKVPQDLDGLELPQSAAGRQEAAFGDTSGPPRPVASQTTQATNPISFRVAGAVAGACILLSVFVPVVTVPVLGNVSLIQAANFIRETGENGPYIGIAVVAAIGLLVALVSQGRVRRHSRGLPLLALGALLVGLMGFLVVAYNLDPDLQADEDQQMILSVIFSPSIGIVMLVGGFVAVFVLGWWQNWVLKGGKILNFLALALLAAMVVGSGLYFRFGLVARPEIALEKTEDALWGGDKLTARLTNTGNLTYHLSSQLPKSAAGRKEAASENAARNQFLLALQYKKEGGSWEEEKHDAGLDIFGVSLFGPDDRNEVQPGKTESVECPQLAATMSSTEPVTYRAVLRNAGGVVATSNEITLQPRRSRPFVPEPAPRPTPPFPTPQPEPPKPISVENEAKSAAGRKEAASEVRAVREKLTALRQLAEIGDIGPFETALREARDAAGALTGNVDEFTREMDDLIAIVKERVARPLVDKARVAFEQSNLDEAENQCRNVIRICKATPLPEKPQDNPDSAMAEALEILSYIEAARNPAMRFDVRLITDLGHNIMAALIVDKLQGRSVNVREGDQLDRFTVKQIVFGQGVVITDGKETVTLRVSGR